jgi:DNA-binding SARP family transcriptional activator
VDSVVLTLMGGFRLSVDGQLVELPVGAQRLVAVLALRGRTSRSRLAGTLWPEATERRALGSLRTAIWRTNQIAPQLVLTTGDFVEVDPRAQVDVRDFVERAIAILRDSDADLAPWPIGAHQDDLLMDWCDSWLTHDRERIHQLRLHSLERISERLTRDGRFRLAVEAALAALRLDVLRESAHRAIIRVHLAEGNIREARRAFAMCVQVLDRELGVAPTAATAALLQNELEGQLTYQVAEEDD